MYQTGFRPCGHQQRPEFSSHGLREWVGDGVRVMGIVSDYFLL